MAPIVSEVDVGQLLGKLEEQRRAHAGISTIAFNLIAFVEDDAALLERMTERIERIASRNPARTLLLSRQDMPASVEGENIRLSVPGVGAQALRSIANELLIPGVRTVLLWAGSELLDPRLEALAGLAGIVVLFSSRADDTPRALSELVSLRSNGIRKKIRDLAFLRLLAWQDTIAQFFDDPDLAVELPHISHVEIRSGSAAEAYYLVGWLASRLGWQPCAEDEFCNADGRSIQIEMHREGTPRRVHSVCLRSPHCDFEVTNERSSDDLMCLSVEGEKRRPRRCVALHDVDMVSLIERAILVSGNQDIYSETLQMVGRLFEHKPQ